jgi:hypothetical protein
MIESNLKDEFILLVWKKMQSKLTDKESKRIDSHLLKCESTKKEAKVEN